MVYNDNIDPTEERKVRREEGIKKGKTASLPAAFARVSLRSKSNNDSKYLSCVCNFDSSYSCNIRPWQSPVQAKPIADC